MKAKPRFTHNCKECKFLGNINGMDAYYCVLPNKSGTSYILRYSNTTYDYYSGRDFEDRFYLDCKEKTHYASIFSEAFIERDLRRRVLIEVLYFAISLSMALTSSKKEVEKEAEKAQEGEK